MRLLNRCAVLLSGTAAVLALLAYALTFVLTLTPAAVVLPFLLLGPAVFCAAAGRFPGGRFVPHRGKITALLLVWGLGTAAWVLWTTGGASGVTGTAGAYLATYKGRVVGPLTDAEAHALPNLWARLLSAWVTMMAGIAFVQVRRSA